MRKKKTVIQFESLFMHFEWIMDFTKKISSLVSLIAFVEFNDSLEWNSIFNGLVNETWEMVRIFDSEIIFIRPNYCSLCYFEPRHISLDLKPLLLTQFRMYQMYLSSQSSIITVILNKAIHQRVLNPYQPILKKAKTTLPFVTIKAFSFVISFISLWAILLSFTLY